MSSTFKSRFIEKYLRCLVEHGYPTDEDRVIFNKNFYESNDLWGKDRHYGTTLVSELSNMIKNNEMPGWAAKSPELADMFDHVVADYKTKYPNSNKHQQQKTNVAKYACTSLWREKYLRYLAEHGYPPTEEDRATFATDFYNANTSQVEERQHCRDVICRLTVAIRDNEMPGWIAKSPKLIDMFDSVVDDYRRKYRRPAVVNQMSGQKGADKRKQPTAVVVPVKKPAPSSVQTKDDEEKKDLQLEVEQKSEKIRQLKREMEKQRKEAAKNEEELRQKIQDMKKVVQTKEERSAKDFELFEEQSKTIHNLKEILCTRDQVIYDKDQEIQDWKTKHSEMAKDEDVLMKLELFEEQAGIIVDQENKIDDLEEKAVRDSKLIEELNKKIHNLEEMLRTRDKAICEGKPIARQEKLLIEQKTALADQEKKIRDLEKTVSDKDRQMQVFLFQQEMIQQLTNRRPS